MSEDKMCPISGYGTNCNTRCVAFAVVSLSSVNNVQYIEIDDPAHEKQPYCKALKCFISK